MLSTLGIIFLSLSTSLAGTFSSKPSVNGKGKVLTTVTAAADATFAKQQPPKSLSKSQAIRLIQSCAALAKLDPEKHRQLCAENSAVAWAVNSLTKRVSQLSQHERDIIDRYRGERSPGVPPSPTPQGPQPQEPSKLVERWQPALLQPSSERMRQAAVNVLAAEIEELSAQYEGGATRGNRLRELEAQARFRVLYLDLKESLPPNIRASLPEDELAMISKESLERAILAKKAEAHRLQYQAALFDLPETTISLNSLNDEIRKLQILVNNYQVTDLHRARDAIDLAKMKQLSRTRPQRISSELKRMKNEWRAKYPALLLPPDILLPPVKLDLRFPLSERVFEATRNYLHDQVEFLRLESSLMAAYHQANAVEQREGRKLPKYAKWWASQLSDDHLAMALNYLAAAIKQYDSPVSDDYDLLSPESNHKTHLNDLFNTLRVELQARANSAALPQPPRIVKPDNQTPKLEKLFYFRLASQQYDSPSKMPPVVAEQVQAIAAEIQQEDFRQAKVLFQNLQEHLEIAALSNAPLDESQLKILQSARNNVAETLTRLIEINDERAKKGYISRPAERRELAVMISVLGNRPPPPPPMDNGAAPPPPEPMAPRVRKPLPSGGGSGGSALSLYDAILISRIEDSKASLQALQDSQASLKTLKVALKDQATTPRLVGAEAGRVSVTREALWQTGYKYQELHPQPATTRLPDKLHKWNGMLDPTGKPFDYQSQVKRFKDFKPVGGGIHFGDTATVEEPTDLKAFTLTYDPKAETLILLGPEGRAFSYGTISPQELKPLYRYAVAKPQRNAAITIGWTGRYDPESKFNPESPVLLDPYFVDTCVGQVLFEADSLPWELGRTYLPGGQKNPIAQKFDAAYKRFAQKSPAPLIPFFRGLAKFDNITANTWVSQFDGDRYIEILVVSLLSNNGLSEAKNDFLLKSRYEDLKSDYTQLLWGSVGQTDSLFKLSPFRNQANELQRMAKTIEYIESLQKLIDESEQKQESRLDVVQEICTSIIGSGNADTKWIQLWGALVRSKVPKVSDLELAELAFFLLPKITVAVLMDEPTKIRLEGDKIHLSGKMLYQYATSTIRADQTGIRVGDWLPSGTNKVVRLKELADIANDALPELAERYAPLGNVIKYAQVTAFLRWANQAKQKGDLLGIDLSSLASYAASDRKITRTPDAVIK